MSKLPALTPKEVVKLLGKQGFMKLRQKGSHIILVNEQKNIQVVVPMHNASLKKGTLMSILRQAEIPLHKLREGNSQMRVSSLHFSPIFAKIRRNIYQKFMAQTQKNQKIQVAEVDLSELIEDATRLLSKKDQAFWLGNLERMNADQKRKLAKAILDANAKLDEIEEKAGEERGRINADFLKKLTKFQKEKLKKIRSVAESEDRKKDDQREEALLKKLSDA
ncbi:type II toxin-antitoxin system HicA family toxin [Candidatus Peregrinibacteria bacterium]|nr:type II toxin-antitoxin system HicA family toxin [Candidatus Peregrinibacteria bacterium]